MDVPWENLVKHFADSNRFIKSALSSGGVVFVHCYGGVSRSATLVIAYLMQQYSMSMFDAMSFVKSKRSVIYPNPGF
jgi:protein-tyrosine phosphatase